ncbi:hypothetical protein NUSPORA_01751 [Nucleospora cyclopteri]
MRASPKMKKIMDENSKKMKSLVKTQILCNFLTAYIYYRNGVSWVSFLKWTIPEIIGLFSLYYLTRPITIFENENILKVISVRSINDSGLPCAFADMIGFGVAAKASKIIFRFGGWLLIGIPISFIIEIFYKPFKRITTGSSSINKKTK